MSQLPFDLLPEVARFLANSPIKPVIGGEERASANGQTFATRDPGTGTVLAEVYFMQPEDVDAAVRAAQAAFHRPGWADLTPHARGVLLHRLIDAVEQRKSVFAQIEALDCGKVLRQAEADVQNFIDTMRYYTEMALHVDRRAPLAVSHYDAYTYRAPWGPCAFIFPWNFPLLLVGWGIAPALAVGNTVVIKPAEDTPLSTIYLGRLAAEIGFPSGVINVLPGDGEITGAALTKHPGIRRMSFTGSPEVGRLVAEACGRNLVPVKLELGGKGGAVVFDDVDVEATAQQLVQAVTFHSGQVCCTATRWIVQKGIYDRFVDAAVKQLQSLRIGHELKRGVQMGPVISEKQRRRILSYIDRGREQGAELVYQGSLPEAERAEGGTYVAPALLAGALDNVAAQEEIFGPVAYLTPFDDEEDAVRKVNATDYGLANSVWSRDLDRAQRVAEAMEAANSWINAHNLFPHGVPYGGIKKSGMGGGVLSEQTLFDYLRATSVVRPRG
ncbi:MAG: aldehyde dehydrogenase family protein [Thermogutta sp.]